MKQGTGNNSDSGRKIEPRSSAMNVKGVGQIGQVLGNHAMDDHKNLNPIENLHAGQGYKASMVGRTVMKTGSQGRHDS